MQPITIKEIKEAVQGKLIQGDPLLRIENITTDSRKVSRGDLFIAIIGDRFDGHRFIEEAAKNGAAAVLTDRVINTNYKLAVIIAEDTTRALQDLAHYYRKQFSNLTVVGITGSAGKTTTKDMTAALLNENFKVLKTDGNYNNHIGLPLTLLQLEGDEDFAILEMGMSSIGEIDLLAKIALPSYGIVTNIGAAHLQNLGSIENVALAKGELINNLPGQGTAILNYDDKLVRQMSADFTGEELLYYGFSEKADLQAFAMEYNTQASKLYFTVKQAAETRRLFLNRPGKHNVYNALAAIALGRKVGLDWEMIQAGLKKIKYTSLRLDIQKSAEGVLIINDTYNANPLSMKAALDVLTNMQGARKIAILGSMLELGDNSREAHLEIGKYLADGDCDLLLAVGQLGAIIAEGAYQAGFSQKNIYKLNNNNEAAKLYQEHKKEGDLVLVKGSRANKMEEIVAAIVDQED